MQPEVELLKQARDLIAEHWGKGGLYQNGRYCALGAINVSDGMSLGHRLNYRDGGGSVTRLKALEALSLTIYGIDIKGLGETYTKALHTYNDNSSQDKMLFIFDETIRRLEGSLPGRSKEIHVEPIKEAPPAPRPKPAPSSPEPIPAPAPTPTPEREPIPA